MVLCAVGGVQSQSVTVDRQMKRYGVPRLAFINKMDRTGADPQRVCRDMAEKLGLHVVPIQLPMGEGDAFTGVIDLVTMQALTFAGDKGDEVVAGPVPEAYAQAAHAARRHMLEELSMFSDELMAMLLEESEPDEKLIRQTLRAAAINRDIVPALMGSALGNQGVQPLMDAVCHYLPSPLDRSYFARDHDNLSAEVPLISDAEAPLVAMAFKIVDDPFGQLTYTRVYQGRLQRGQGYRNARTNKVVRVGRIVRMHADSREEIVDAGPGDIVALIGVECASGDTICGEGLNYSLESIFVADPVISLSLTPASSADQDRMAKALARFMKEDPTFRVHTDVESGQTIIAGMGELHLDIYVERMKREYKASVTVGAPNVSYREAPGREVRFEYRHKKQTGGAGQYAHVIGHLVPLPDDSPNPYEFEDNVRGGRIPREYIPAVSKGFEQAMKKGPLAGYQVVGCKMCLEDGTYHDVDSSEMAFRIAAIEAFKQAFRASRPRLLEPVMAVEVETPSRHQGPVVGDLNSRRGMVLATEARGATVVIQAEVPLANMFGYATVLRSLSQGMATFSMEMKRYAPVPERIALEIIADRQANEAARR